MSYPHQYGQVIEIQPNFPFIYDNINLPVHISYFTGETNDNIIEWIEQFETTARNSGWTTEQMFTIVPTLLRGTARRWFNFINGKFTPEDERPKNYNSLKESMIRDLCPSDFRSQLSQQLHNATQQPGQSTSSFIYEIHELCQRIDENIPEMIILSIIKEKLLPQIKYGIALQNPKSLQQLLESARLAERAMISCNNPFVMQKEKFNPSMNDMVMNLQKSIERLSAKFENLSTNQACTFCKRAGHTESNCRRKLRSSLKLDTISSSYPATADQPYTLSVHYDHHYTQHTNNQRERDYYDDDHYMVNPLTQTELSLPRSGNSRTPETRNDNNDKNKSIHQSKQSPTPNRKSKEVKMVIQTSDYSDTDDNGHFAENNTIFSFAIMNDDSSDENYIYNDDPSDTESIKHDNFLVYSINTNAEPSILQASDRQKESENKTQKLVNESNFLKPQIRSNKKREERPEVREKQPQNRLMNQQTIYIIMMLMIQLFLLTVYQKQGTDLIWKNVDHNFFIENILPFIHREPSQVGLDQWNGHYKTGEMLANKI